MHWSPLIAFVSIEELQFGALVVLLLAGALLILGLVFIFIRFLFRAAYVLRISWKPTPVGPRCARCATNLPSEPSKAVVGEEKTVFIFVCSNCGHPVKVDAVKPEETE